MARATGLHIVQGTGAYVEPSHPDWVREATIDELAERFADEVPGRLRRLGNPAGLLGEIGTSGVSADAKDYARVGDITRNEEKVLRAAGRASVETGAAVSVHLDVRGHGAFRIIDILEEEGVAPDRMIMCHLDPVADLDYHLAVAAQACSSSTTASAATTTATSSGSPGLRQPAGELARLPARGRPRGANPARAGRLHEDRPARLRRTTAMTTLHERWGWSTVPARGWNRRGADHEPARREPETGARLSARFVAAGMARAPIVRGGGWDSNPRPPGPQPGALPAELPPPGLSHSSAAHATDRVCQCGCYARAGRP